MTPRTVLKWGSPIVLSLALAACNRGGDGSSELEAARKSSAAQDYKAAVISAKAALQRNGDNGEARLVLGQALLESGDARAAVVELRKAQELNVPDAKVLPLLARALLGTGESKQVVQQFAATRLDDAAASAELKTAVASAHAALGARDAALETVQSALQEWPQHNGAKLLLARLKAADKDMTGAMAAIDEVLARDARHVDALLLRGDLQRLQNETDKALASYREAVAAKPTSVPALVSEMALLLELGKLPEANAELAKLKAAAPKNPETLLYEAQLAFAAEDFAKTREVTAQLLKMRPDHPIVLALAGMAEWRLNAMGPAESFLGQAVKAAPNAPGPRQMLARVYLRTGQGQRALEVLQPILQGASPDAATLTLAGQAQLLEGDTASADGYFARAAKLNPKDATARTALAVTKLARGNNEGYAELEALASADAHMTRADLALISARLRANDLPGALKAIDALQKKEPDKPLAYVLRGKVLLQKKDDAGAKAAFEKALQVDPTYYTAAAALAGMDFAAGQPEQARQRFETLLKADPKNVRALMALADLKSRTGGSKDEVAKALAEASRANPSEPAPRLLLTRFLLSRNDMKAALAAAQDADAAIPNNAEVLDTLGTTQIAAGQAQQAVSTFGKLAALRPNRPEPQMRMAEAYVALKDYAGAKRSLEQALKFKPGLLPAQLALGRVAMLAGQPGEALQIAKAVQRAEPKLPAGFLLEADVESGRGHPEAAVAPLRAALPLDKGPQVAIYLHRSLATSGKRDEAERFSAEWRKDHPRDMAFRYYLGDVALARNDYTTAEAMYRSVLEIQPEHAMALNNVAWLMTQQQRSGAVALAQKANQLMPDQASLMDTLAWALANEQQAPKAIEVQKKAIEKAPDNASLKLTLAKIYLKAGDRKQARSELDELAKMGDKFPAQAEVANLIKQL